MFTSREYSVESSVNSNSYAVSKLSGELATFTSHSICLRTNYFDRLVGKYENVKPSFTDWIYALLSTNQPITGFADVFFNPLSGKPLPIYC